MKGEGPKHERETVINFNEEDATATIWTASESVYRRLKKRGFEPSEDGERHAVFTMPKRAVRLPSQPRVIPEAQLAEMRRRIPTRIKGKQANLGIPEGQTVG